MAKKKPGMSDAEQVAAFHRTVRELADAGELSLTDADAAFERIVAKVVKSPDSPSA